MPGTLAMIAASAGFAWCVAQWVGLHPATLLLATAPGGIAEMCITAKVLQLGVPVVTDELGATAARWGYLLLAVLAYGWVGGAVAAALAAPARCSCRSTMRIIRVLCSWTVSGSASG